LATIDLARLSFLATLPCPASALHPKTGKYRFFVEEKPPGTAFGRVFAMSPSV
jgi:hypothetical protein